VDGTPSELSALMARSGLSATVWQREILRAFQAWTAQADLNIGRVGDNGAALGTAGFEQGDSRFGDIRIFAVPMAMSVLAITTPPGDLAGTRTGDIILNSNYNFGVGAASQRDLYTVFLQEAGHAFGVGNSPSTASVMYEFYQGPRAGLNAEDVARVRDLYDARPTGTWEPASGNNTGATATAFVGTNSHLTYGDMASAADADWYSFTGPASRTITVQLQTAGLSLLAARVTVFNSSGGGIAAAVATGAGQDLTITLSLLTSGAKYFIRIDEAAGTPFAAGQYRLRVADPSNTDEVITLGGAAPTDDAGSNELFLTSTRLDNVGTNGATQYRAFANLRAGGDVDVYKIRSPLPGMNQANVLTATVRAFGNLIPQVTVFNSIGLPVAGRVTSNGNGLYTVVVDNAAPSVDYHLQVRGQSGSAGAYELRAGFRSQVTAPHQVASGLLTILNPKMSGSITVTGSAQIYFRLTAALTPLIGPSMVLRVYDSANRVKFQLLAGAGDKVDGVALLGPGSYRVQISGNGALLPFVLSGYTLEMALLTDPTGVQPSDPNNPSDPPPPPPPPDDSPPSGYNYYNDRGYYVWGERTPSGSG
jgi:hypothetical protein